MVPLSTGRNLAHEPRAACLSDKQQPVPERLHASDDARVDPGGRSHTWWVNFPKPMAISSITCWFRPPWNRWQEIDLSLVSSIPQRVGTCIKHTGFRNK